MKKHLAFYFLIFLFQCSVFAQTEQLAQNYFDNGEFEKAESLYHELYNKQPYNSYFLEKYITAQQALQKFDEAEVVLQQHFERLEKQNNASNFQHLWVIAGYNFQLKNEPNKSKELYDKALNSVKQNPGAGYSIAHTFENYHLIDYALESYQWIMQAIPSANYYYQIAQLYGEKGDIEKMFDIYLDLLLKQNADVTYIQRFMGRYLTDDNQGENNILLRKLVVKRIQSNPMGIWYKTLSWLYIQQKEYSKALVQEKAYFETIGQDINGVLEVGIIAFDDHNFISAQEAFDYVLQKTTLIDIQIQAIYYKLESLKKIEKNYDKIEQEYQKYLTLYQNKTSSVSLQTSYAQFLTFFRNNPTKAIEILDKVQHLTADRFQKSNIKLQLGDIYTFTGKFNQALIIYTQVQNDLKNHPLAETARYKIAQTSYYKGDFEWANSQLKVLKKGTTKLIANDAIDLSLLLSDNMAQDSTQIALRQFAKADLLAYQERNSEAIDTLTVLLQQHKGHAIEDETLYKQAILFEKTNNFEKAAHNYLQLIDTHPDDLLTDDALFRVAVLYDEKLMEPEKAKLYFEKIVLEHPSSYYLITARKRFRELRGDTMMP